MKRSELKRKTRLRPVSDRRRKQMAERVRPGHGIPDFCELYELLRGVRSFGEFVRLASVGQLLTLDPHHCWTPPRWDHPGNVVTVCRVVHDWIHDCFPRAGRMVATEALCRAGRFDRELTRERWGRDPIDAIHVDYDNGIFACDPTLDALATMLLQRF